MKIPTSFTTLSTIAALAIILSTVNAVAATFTVTNTKDSGAGSLRQAITDANTAASADTIVFDSSFNTARTITLAGTVLLIGTNADLTITGPGANLLTVSGNNVSRVFQIESGIGQVTISGMTLTAGNGLGGNGGAIQNSGILTITNLVVNANTTTGFGGGVYSGSGSTLNVVNCTISNSTGALGGGITVQSGTSTITGSTISNNIATSQNGAGHAGGGIYADFGVMNIINTLISGNQTTLSSGSGGGIAGAGSQQLTVTNSTITSNSSKADGGGLFFQPNNPPAFLNISNSTISNNIANTDNDNFGNGGGLFLAGVGQSTISGSTINGNRANTGTEAGSAAGNGGGIDVSGLLNLTNSTVSGNTADRNGGGIFALTGGTLDSSTVVDNTAAMDGGGLNATSAGLVFTFHNTIFANNTAATEPDIAGSVVSQGYNLIENLSGATITGDTATNVTGVDPNLGPLQDNGGMTLTHALLADSPAIDQGESGAATTDQRGAPRPFDNPAIPNAPGGDGSDIGAFEDQATGLLNISTRLQVLTGDQVLIGGFIVTGADPKMVILRAIGPSLGAFGISGPLADPVLELRAADGSIIQSNDNWKMDQQDEIEATGLAPTNGLEAAIVATLEPGNYTAVMSGKDGGTGVGLVEVYDLNQFADSELANISTRGFVDTGDNVMIGGFILGGGTGGSQVLVRAIGPTLSDFGVTGALADPTLELRDEQGTLVSSNDNWTESAQMTEIKDTGLAPQKDLESAVLEALPAGSYTAIVAGQSGGTGVGLVEVYRLP